MARAPSPRSEAGRHSYAATAGSDRADGPSARPPWLEEADEVEEAGATLIGRRTFWALMIGLIGLIGGVALGVWLIGRQTEAPIDLPAAGAEVPLVRNPGPWKITPTGPGIEGKLVPEQDGTVYGTGDGQDPNSSIATDAVPEEPGLRPGTLPGQPDPLAEDADTQALQPAPGPSPTPLPAPAGKPSPVPPPATKPAPLPWPAPQPVPRPAPPPAAVATVTPREAPPPAPPMAPIAFPPQPASAGGSTVQLGAFSSEGRAREAWKSLSARFAYLAPLTPVILPTAKDGKTLYRLRTTPGGPAEARDICGRLKAAGDSCSVVE